MFVESENDPANDPLVLWLNGGPGCSSLLSFWTEHGPLRFDRHTGNITLNDYAWNKVANVIYLESPAGVGYSYSDPDSKNYTIDDDQTSLDNLNAVKAFFKRYQQYKKSDFFVTGEGYAANWVATLSVRLTAEPEINFKGFAIGNGFFDSKLSLFSSLSFSFHHGLLSELFWEFFMKTCNCPAVGPCDLSDFNPICQEAASANVFLLHRWMDYMNPYDIYAKCDYSTPRNESDRISTSFHYKDLNVIKRYQPQKYSKQYSGDVFWCFNYSKLIAFMNRKNVKEALHFSFNAPKNWLPCSQDVYMGYKRTYENIKPQILQVLEAGKHAMFYNGDTDMLYPFLSARWFVDSLGLQPLSGFLPWTDDDGQVAGWAKPFGLLSSDSFGQNLSLVTVRGAGHFVSQSKPLAALKLFKAFLENKIPYLYPEAEGY